VAAAEAERSGEQEMLAARSSPRMARSTRRSCAIREAPRGSIFTRQLRDLARQNVDVQLEAYDLGRTPLSDLLAERAGTWMRGGVPRCWRAPTTRGSRSAAREGEPVRAALAVRRRGNRGAAGARETGIGIGTGIRKTWRDVPASTSAEHGHAGILTPNLRTPNLGSRIRISGFRPEIVLNPT